MFQLTTSTSPSTDHSIATRVRSRSGHAGGADIGTSWCLSHFDHSEVIGGEARANTIAGVL